MTSKNTLCNELLNACKLGNLDKVKECLTHNADVHYYDDAPLRSAACNGYLDIVKYLIENADVNIFALNHDTLHWALHNKHLEMIIYLKNVYIEIYGEEFLCYNCLVLPTCLKFCGNFHIMKSKE